MPVSARDFVAQVARANPRLELLEAAVDQAAAGVKSAGAWANPAVSLDREDVQSQPESFVTLELPLEVSGRRGLRIESSELGLEAARATAARDRAALLFEALGVYWSAAQARERLSLLEHEKAALAHMVEALRARTTAGDSSGYDLDRLELESDGLDDLVAEAAIVADGWQRRLALVAGSPQGRLDATDAQTLPARPPAVAELVNQARDARRDLLAVRLLVSQAEREVGAARRGWIPSFVLSGGAKSSVVDRQTRWGYVAGVSLTLPLLDHGQGESAHAEARVRQARGEQRRLEAQVTSEVLTAHAALTRTLVEVERFERTQVPRLDRLVRRAQASYQEGERPVFELLDAYRTARGIRLRLVDLRHKALLADLELSQATGQSPGESK